MHSFAVLQTDAKFMSFRLQVEALPTKTPALDDLARQRQVLEVVIIRDDFGLRHLGKRTAPCAFDAQK